MRLEGWECVGCGVMRTLTAPTSDWRYEVPPDTSATCLLLTVGRSLVKGKWYGEHNQYFMAWAPMPKGNKEIERRLREERRGK